MTNMPRKLRLHSIRWKLVLASLAIVFVPTYFLSLYAVKAFDRFTRKEREDVMVSYAHIAGEQYKAMVLGLGDGGVGGLTEEFALLLQAFNDRIDGRVQILSMRGDVLFDSDPEDPQVGVNFSARKEVSVALTGTYKAKSHLTEDGNRMFYYVALPVKHEGETVCVGYVVGHTRRITLAIIKMAKDQRLAMFAALAVALVVTVVFAQTMTRRLRRLTTAATEFARGHAPMTVKVSGRDEIGELGESVRQMAAEIGKRNRYNRNFISTIVHELKMPLTAIKGAAELLEQGAADRPETREKFLGNIRHEVERMIRMVWELTELTKLDIEVLRGQKQEVNYCECVKDIVERLEQSIDTEHAHLKVVITDKEIWTNIMPGRIEQVIFNLVDNAFRYTDTSGTVELCVEGEDGVVITSVRDNGRGISAANMPKVFDRFFTTEPKDRPADYGSGLGLAIAKSIVENHQGRIWVESESGEGTRFFFSLPVVQG